jgi:hypothetical protein
MDYCQKTKGSVMVRGMRELLGEGVLLTKKYHKNFKIKRFTRIKYFFSAIRDDYIYQGNNEI